MNDNKICFVVMGFGQKVDYATGRTLDLDKTFENIIKPVCEELGYSCIRADEISKAGIIDVNMYKMLLTADLVIADISTSNVNAVYELGVRHALRRKATILMKEDKGNYHFDLNHSSTIFYEHLEKDIGCTEAQRVKKVLKEFILNIDYNNQEPDSPLYTFLPNLSSPILNQSELETLVEEMEDDDNLYFELKNQFESNIVEGNFPIAIEAIKKLIDIRGDDEYLLQQLALHTYKSEIPNKKQALLDALGIISKLHPSDSNNPETTGIAGAINKNLYLITEELSYLNNAISLYQRGYILKKDYYNGENLATCYSLKAKYFSERNNDFECKLFTYLSNETMKDVLIKVEYVIDSANFLERDDIFWIYATAASMNKKLGNSENFQKFESLFLSREPSEWQKETFYKNLQL